MTERASGLNLLRDEMVRINRHPASRGRGIVLHGARFEWTAGANWRAPFGLDLSLNANYRSGVYTDVARPQSDWRVGGRTIVNARVGYDIGAFTISVFANNLFDEKYKQYDYFAVNRAVLRDPRQVGALLEARF